MIKSKSIMKLEKFQQEKEIITQQVGSDYQYQDYQYFKDHYQLIAVDLSKQKELDGNHKI